MESVGSQSQPRDRSRPPAPPYPRAPSRSSTSTSNTRMTPQSNNSSSTNLPPSPTLRHSHAAHRLNHSSSRRGSIPERPRSQLSKESSDESHQGLPVVSTFLQEKLQRERRFEIERSSSRMSNDMTASVDLRVVHSSPARSVTADGKRPRSSGGSGETSKKKGLGLKEMEQV